MARCMPSEPEYFVGSSFICCWYHGKNPCMTWDIVCVSFSESTVGFAPEKSSCTPEKSRFKLDISSDDGSMLMDDASKAGMLDRSRFMPDRSRLLERSAEESPAVSLDWSNVNAC